MEVPMVVMRFAVVLGMTGLQVAISIIEVFEEDFGIPLICALLILFAIYLFLGDLVFFVMFPGGVFTGLAVLFEGFGVEGSLTVLLAAIGTSITPLIIAAVFIAPFLLFSVF
jgi:hypothetical protein